MTARAFLFALLLTLASLVVAADPELSRSASPRQTAEDFPAQVPPTARLEQVIRETYAAYETTAAHSGHDLRLRLSDFRTIQREDFDRHRWLGLMTPPSDQRIGQWREYYEGPSSRTGKVVRYHLAWETIPQPERQAIQESLALLADSTISEALELQRTLWKRTILPLAVTTYQVEVELNERSRSYRAAAFWQIDDSPERFRMTIEDHVVPEVESAVDERAAPVDAEEMQQMRRPEIGLRSVVGSSLAGACVAQTTPRNHATVELDDNQGHQSGEHHSQLQVSANCIYSDDCYVQCQPSIAFKRCSENGIVDLYFGCTHTSKHDAKISGGGANSAPATCAGALACGIKECCGFFCGDISLSFSGSGGGLTAAASNSGSGVTYNLSSQDTIQCAAPTKVEDPCAQPLMTAPGRTTAALLNPCDDGGGTGGSGPGGTGDTRDPGSPILVDLDRGGLRLTSLAAGVSFDLDADGVVDRVAWTAAGSGDAFLALDRNGNGRIDDGRELFGNFTAQPPSDEPNGFLALRVFDQAAEGGDEDGRLTAADAIYSRLLLWHDHDHDGVSQAGELSSLDDVGVRDVHLTYVDARRRDRHGNELRYASRVRLARGTTQAIDVFFPMD